VHYINEKIMDYRTVILSIWPERVVPIDAHSGIYRRHVIQYRKYAHVRRVERILAFPIQKAPLFP
jgi:hypothetical protein